MNLSAEFRYLFFFFLAFFILYSPLDFFRDSRPPPGGRSASSNSCIVSEYFIVKKKVEGGKSFRRSRERRREEPGARTASFASKKVSATALAMSMTHSFSALKSAAARGVATLLGVTLLSVLPFAAQQSPSATPPAGTLKVTTSVVNVFAVVKDRGGHLVPDLDKDDFEVTENNTTQEIRYFSRETDTPLTLGILVDTSPSQERVLPIEQEEAKAFVRQVIRPKDIAFVMHFDSDVELLQDFTSDTMRLARAIDETTIGGGGPGGGALPSTFPGVSVGGTHLYDAVYLAATDPLKNEIGRKVVIVLTDGVDEGSTEKLNSALEAAQRADTIIYSINISDVSFYYGRGGYNGDSVLHKLSDETGGRVVEVGRNKKKDLSEAFQQIASELRTQYLLGYSSADTRRDGSYRKIRVRVSKGDYKIQARRGYYAPSS